MLLLKIEVFQTVIINRTPFGYVLAGLNYLSALKADLNSD